VGGNAGVGPEVPIASPVYTKLHFAILDAHRDLIIVLMGTDQERHFITCDHSAEF
jgi:hypothetical protein